MQLQKKVMKSQSIKIIAIKNNKIAPKNGKVY